MQQYYEENISKERQRKKNKEKKTIPSHNSKDGEEKQNFID